jgi:hypothetical protein
VQTKPEICGISYNKTRWLLERVFLLFIFFSFLAAVAKKKSQEEEEGNCSTVSLV